ncbi:MAG: hypothetical protein J6V58_05310 [Clostridia bacterium]|nr:hypothetical protein [Clostridia bacterium]
MKKFNVKTLVAFAIIFSVTIIMILFAGTLDGAVKTEFDNPKITDEMFVPGSVIALSDKIGVLSDELADKKEEIDLLTEELKIANAEIDLYKQFGDIISLINNGELDKAKELLSEIKEEDLSDNAINIYNLITKEIEENA